jgi:hypothetical protein
VHEASSSEAHRRTVVEFQRVIFRDLEQQGVMKSLPHEVSIHEIQIVGPGVQWLESRWIKEVCRRDLEPFDLA